MTYRPSDLQTRCLTNPRFPGKNYHVSWSNITGLLTITDGVGTIERDILELNEQMNRFIHNGWVIEGDNYGW